MPRLLLLLLLVIPICTGAASFDCAKAKSLVEITICNDPVLSRLDDELAVIYQTAKVTAADPKAFQSATRAAWQQRENCRAKQCIANWYSQRKTSLLASTPDTRNVRIDVKNGPNYVDFTGEGTSDLIVSGWRENLNAHSFELVSFYTTKGFESDNSKSWNIVPIRSGDKEDFQITVRGGADCLTQDFRLIRGVGKAPATLVLASRPVSTGYANAETVTFSYFSLAFNSEGEIGAPAYWFQKSRSTKSKRAFCDVGDALQAELGLPAR